MPKEIKIETIGKETFYTVIVDGKEKVTRKRKTAEQWAGIQPTSKLRRPTPRWHKN